jgi:hypothetical protein
MYLRYDLLDAGWARAVVGDDSRHIEMPVSYLHDSLRDLGSAILALGNGAPEVTVTFVDEPGEHHLVISRNVDDSADIEIRRFDDHPPRELERYEVLFRAASNVRQLREEVLESMVRILEKEGVDGYLAKWKTAPFPSEELAALAKVR